MSLIAAHSVCKSYGPVAVLDGVDVIVEAGEKLGLVGLNGQGKSTLARILAGEEQADTGEIMRRRGLVTVYLSQSPTLPKQQSALDVVLGALGAWSAAMERYERANLSLAESPELDSVLLEQQHAEAELERLGGWNVRHRAEATLGHLGIAELDQFVGTMSGGQQRRVALAAALVAAPELLILDEPTNHLDLQTVEWLESHLVGEFAGTLLLVTHDRYLLDNVVSRTLEVSAGSVHSYDGGYAAYLEAKHARLQHEERAESNRQNFLRREVEWLRRSPKARTGKQKARIGRAEQALNQRGPERQRTAQMALDGVRSSKIVVELEDASVAIAGKTLAEHLDLVATKHDRIGIVGPNGCGKTTLLRTIVGQIEPSAGRRSLAKSVRIAYLSQARDNLDPSESVYENVSAGRSHIELGGAVRDVRGYLQSFLFDYDQQRQPVSSLSGGERTRVALAKLLSYPANLVVLDEPTNDLDVQTLGALEEMLLDYAGCTLIVTHDRWFLDRVATSILAHDSGTKWIRYAGGYADYVAQRDARRALEDAPVAATTSDAASSSASQSRPAKAPKRKTGLTYAERLELEQIEPAIQTADERVAQLQAKLADPDTYSDSEVDVRQLTAELEGAQRDCARLMERWEALELKRQG